MRRFKPDWRSLADALWWGSLGALAAVLVEEARPELWGYVAPLCVGLLAGLALMRMAERREEATMEVFR